jgi:hypothetical protein
MVCRPAQRASRSPSQGRRPWRLPPPPRPAQRANRSTNRAGSERNCWPVGPAHVVVDPSRPAGPGWENGWPLGPPDACCLSPRATTDPSGVPEGRRRSSAATTPGQRPPTTPASRRGCQNAWVNKANADDAHGPVHRPLCAAVSVRHPNNPRFGGWLRVAPGDFSWRPLPRCKRCKHR